MEETTRNDNSNFGTHDSSAHNTSAHNTAYDAGATPPPPSAFNQAPVRKLYRTEGPISGVSGGIADYFNLDPSVVRLVMVVGALITFPAIPLAYAAAWLIIPEANPAPVAPIMPPAPTGTTGNPVPPAPVNPVDDLAVDDSTSEVVSAN
ncbi:MAG: PspC domain-containing protein [Acidimicrobiales bacterium]